MRTTPIEELLDKQLRNKRFAALYLTESFQEGTEQEFLVALYDVVRVHGGVKAFVKKTGVSRQHLHKLFSGKAEPRLPTLRMVLNALGFTIEIVLLKRAA